jgi:hypothetical protein
MSRYFIAFLAASFALLCFVAVLDRMATGQLRQFRKEGWSIRFSAGNPAAPNPVRQD